jgi:serine/threonine protein phosphatase PrpC
MNFSIHQASDIGNRKYNQDRVAYAYRHDALLMVLADGMGGHTHGEVAAGLAIETFVESFASLARIDNPQAFLSATMRVAHRRIMALPQNRDHAFPGTTCVAALVLNGMLYWGHAGDSRFYLLRDGVVLSKTLDHSMVQMWLECGAIDEQEARTHPRRNQITNCLGGVEDLFEIELGIPVLLQPDDVVLLCSDGLSGPFLDDELVSAFAGGAVDVVLDKLILRALALEFGHSDNATGIAMRWGGTEPLHETDVVISNILEI